MNNLQAKQQKSKRNLLLHVVPLVAATSPLVLFFQPAFAANTLTTLVNFKGSNGANPAAGIFIGTDGNIYGTTSLGGTKNKGTVFKLSSPSFTTLTTLVNFSGATGAKPVARLFQNSDGNLYGSTNLGGTSNLGTIFRLTSPTFTTLKTLANFNGTNGANPAGRLILGSDSRLWGTTTAGGSANLGTIFKVPLAGGSPTVVVSFKGTNGSAPLARLQLGSDGNYYGTTSTGGSANKGTAFKLTPTGTLTSFNFSGANGASPESGLVESSGFLYGTARLGGVKNKGAIFKIPVGGGTPVLVASFTGANGANPVAAVTKGSDGNFYGTTSTGGTANKGAIYKLVGSTITKLFDFNGTNGQTPESTLIPVSATTLAFYGTASAGGSGLKGTVFKFTP